MDRQAADLTTTARGGEQVFGFGVVAVDGQHLPGQRRRGGTVTPVDGGHCPIEQLINRRTAPLTRVAFSTLAHLGTVSSLVGTVSPMAQVIVHSREQIPTHRGRKPRRSRITLRDLTSPMVKTGSPPDS
jgi:hypothetical protein